MKREQMARRLEAVMKASSEEAMNPLKLLRPMWMGDQEWLVTKIGVLYLLVIAIMFLAWWRGWLRELPPR